MGVTRSVCIVIFFLFQCLAHSQEVEKDISLLDRFSVSLTANYHYAPWTKLNESLGAIHDEVTFDPLFNATGSYDKIVGDGSFRGNLGYGLSDKLRVIFTGDFLQETSNLDLKNYWDDVWTGDANEFMQYRLRVYSVGAGISYDYQLSKLLSLNFTAIAESAFGRLHFEYDAVGSGEQIAAVADMNKDVWGGQISVGIKTHVYGQLALIGSLDYRLLRFPSFTGSGSYVGTISGEPQPWISINSPTQLVEGDHYIGVHYMGGEDSYENPYAPYSLYYGTPYIDQIGQNNPPASVNLSSLGGSLGFEFQF